MEDPARRRAVLLEIDLTPFHRPGAAIGLAIGPAQKVEGVFPKEGHAAGLDVEDVPPGIAGPVIGRPAAAEFGGRSHS